MDSSGHHVDDILDNIGGCGRFQISLSVVAHAMKLPTVFTMTLMVFSIASPSWRCVDDITSGSYDEATTPLSYNVSHNIYDHTTTAISTPGNGGDTGTSGKTTVTTATQSYTNSSNIYGIVYGNTSEGYNPERSCYNSNDSHCQKIEFSQDMKTIVTEWEMVCGLSWIPATIASIQMAGLFLGHVVSGQVADAFGRKVPLFGSIVLVMLSNLVGYLSNGWLMFGIARALCGFSMGTYLTVQYSLPVEVMSAKWRSWLLQMPSWQIHGSLFALCAYLMPDWRNLHLLTILVTAPFLLLWRFIPDSFRWYLSHDRSKDARDVIKYISRVNRVHVTDDHLNTMTQTTHVHEVSGGDKVKYTYIHLFKTWALVRITLLSALNWFNLGLMTYGIQFGLQALSGSFYFNMFIFNAITIPGCFVPIFLVNRIGRRLTTMLTFGLATLGCLGVAVAQYLDIDDDTRKTMTNGCAFFASMGISLAWGPVQIMTQELYPTVIRNLGYGFVNMFARVGAIIGPQLAYMDTRVPGIMYFVCCVVSVCCIVGTLGLSETKGEQLPDKIEKDRPEDRSRII